ncbi:MAG: peptide ABC transporter substrate-binding protein [Pseudomonadales bacterium]
MTSSSTSLDRAALKQIGLLAALALAVVVALMYLLAWAADSTGTGAAVKPAVDAESRTITLLLREEPPQLNSTLATDQISSLVLGHVMQGLLRYDVDGRLEPGVAERWSISETGATFHLRADARWSNGTPVTAHDFVFAWRTAIDPANASQYAFILFPIKNAEAINQSQRPVSELGVRAADDRTLLVEFERPIAHFDKLVAFTTYYPVNEAFYRSTRGRYGADFDTLLYNGPFMLTRWVHGAQLRMEKNPNYWDRENVHLEVIDFPYLTEDPSTQVNLFKDGRIAMTGLSEQSLEEALKQRWHINRFMDGSVFFTEFNHRPDRVTRNRHLRLAIAHALDADELVNKVIKIPGFLTGRSLFPSWLQGVNRTLREEYPAPLRVPDTTQARAYLALALKELGLERLPPLMLLTGDTPLSARQAEYYQARLKRELDIDIRIDRQIFKQRLEKMTNGQFDLVAAGWGPDFNDPLTFGDLFASWNLNNRGRYANPELDRQVRIAQASLDPEERMAAFGAIQQIIHDDVVIFPEFERGLVYVLHPALKGVVRRAVGADPDFTRAYIEEG